MLKKLFLIALLFTGLSVYASQPDDIKPVKNKGDIDIPTELDRNYDELLNNWAAKGSKIECEYEGGSVVLFDDSTYIRRLYSLPTQMELAYNDIVKGFIEMYAGRRRGQVSYMLGQGTYYFPMFEQALDSEGLPLELKYLPIIESALNPIARSRVGATGLWQFMPATGRMYKLEINSLVDERRDPYKSTLAAVQYLKDMYAIYEDWNLVIAAYNCGPGNVNKAIRRSGGKRDYWDIYPYLPRETRGYVPAFIAATYIMNYYADHNICPASTELPALVDTLRINKMVHFEQIADVINVPIDQIRKLNPQFKEDIIPGEHREYALKLPIHNLSSFIAHEDTIYNHKKDELLTHRKVRYAASGGGGSASGGHATYKVKRGDNLGAIAMRHGVSVAKIKRWNGLKSDKLRIGQHLKVSDYIPPKKEQQLASNAKTTKDQVSELVAENGVLKKAVTTTKTVTSNYVVRRGDTWAAIAKKTGASVADIKRWNNKRGNNLMAGWNLKIQKTEIVEELVEIAKPEAELLEVDNASLAEVIDSYVETIEVLEPTSIIIGGESSDTMIEEDEDSLDESNVIYHKVIFGETLSQIAQQYNVTVKDILSWNNIAKENSSDITRLLIILPPDYMESQMVKNELTGEEDTVQL